jgi:hypothetical protein
MGGRTREEFRWSLGDEPEIKKMRERERIVKY